MRRILVTGANKGIGLATVEAILASSADTFVYLGSRDLARGEAARASLLAREPSWASRTAVLALDTSHAESVAAAAAAVARDAPPAPLYGLVNNAGILAGTPREVLATNLAGVERVTAAFLPLLQDGGRIVNVSSGSAPMFVAKCAPERRAFFRTCASGPAVADAAEAFLAATAAATAGAGGDGGAALAAAGYPPHDAAMGAYGASKAFLNCLTAATAAATAARRLRVNACSPGMIATDLLRGMAAQYGKTPEELGAKPPAEGTRAILALLLGAGESSGLYYGSDAQRSPLDKYRSPGEPPYTGEPAEAVAAEGGAPPA